MSVEEACKKISFIQDQHYGQLKEATGSCIKDLSCKLYSHNLISKPVRDSPTFDSIVDELQAGLVQMKYFIQLRLHYERFLDCLSAQGGPSKIASDELYQEWKVIKKEFEELDSKEERRKRTELITNKQLDEYFKQRDEKFEIVEEEVELLKIELKLSQDENRRLLEKVEAGDGASEAGDAYKKLEAQLIKQEEEIEARVNERLREEVDKHLREVVKAQLTGQKFDEQKKVFAAHVKEKEEKVKTQYEVLLASKERHIKKLGAELEEIMEQLEQKKETEQDLLEEIIDLQLKVDGASANNCLSEKNKMRRDLEDQVARVKELKEMVGKLKKDKEEVERNYKKLRAEFEIRLKYDGEEIRVLKAEVNTYKHEVDKQKGLVSQSQEKHKTEVSALNERLANEIKSKRKLANEIASMRRLANTSANKDEAIYSQQQLDDELARMRQQLSNAFADEEELLRAYHEEQATVTSLEQQLNSTRKDLDKTKEESAVLSTRLESVKNEMSVRPYQQHPQSTNIHISNVRNIPIVSAGRGNKGHQYQEKNRRRDEPGRLHKNTSAVSDDSDSDIEENKLIDNIDEEIQQMAEDVRKGSRGPITAEVLFDDGDSSLPYDPNLVCPKCGKQYRVGEIQKLRRHINEFCTGIR